MNGRKARAARRAVYGDHSPRFREYRRESHGNSIPVKLRSTKDFIIADGLRQAYQAAKRIIREHL